MKTTTVSFGALRSRFFVLRIGNLCCCPHLLTVSDYWLVECYSNLGQEQEAILLEVQYCAGGELFNTESAVSRKVSVVMSYLRVSKWSIM